VKYSIFGKVADISTNIKIIACSIQIFATAESNRLGRFRSANLTASNRKESGIMRLLINGVFKLRSIGEGENYIDPFFDFTE